MLKDKLKKSGLKNTTPTTAVYHILRQNHKPLSAQQIWQKLGKKNNLASIYRILEKLSQKDIIKTDGVQDTKGRLEKIYYLAREHHHHFVCQKCQKSFCLPCPLKIKLPKNFKITKHQLLISGLCPKCQN